MATFENSDRLVLVTADQLGEGHRTLEQRDDVLHLPAEVAKEEEEEEEEEEEQQLKGVASEDYQPESGEELELQKGELLSIF